MTNIPDLKMFLLLSCLMLTGAEAAKPSVLISGAFYHKNSGTNPTTIEMSQSTSSWQFACRWIRSSSNENPVLAIEAPTQRSSNNCQFSSTSGPAGCTPSSMKFGTDGGQYQISNLTCRESGNSLTCSAGIVGGFNPLHIGPWFCKSLMDEQEDGIFLQYYKILPQSSLALVSWDPLLADGGNSSASRFECFTKEAVIPPARLTFYLDGVELATSSNLVDWLSDNLYSPRPTMYSLNKTDATVEPPVRGLSLNQQLLASSRSVQLSSQLRNCSGQTLVCSASQGLSHSHSRASSNLTIVFGDGQANDGSSDEVMAEPTIVISRPYARNFNTEPNTIEIPFDRPWEFACRWTRQNASQHPFLAIDVPAQRGYSNCQFGFAGKPPQCTPSSVQFAADTAGQQQSSNVTCRESGNSLTCSISLEVFNPRHVGLWSCRSLSDSRNDSAYLQYYKVLPEESLVLASWDPISPSNWTSSASSTGNSSSTESPSNRFECFTKEAAIPPPRLAFYLGGIELTSDQTRYPVEWLFNTEYSTKPRMFTLNGTETKKDPPRKDLSLNQQLLASSRILFIRLHRSYNSLLLECRATQNLVSGRTIAKSIVLHLDLSNRASTLRTSSTSLGLAGCLTAILMKFTLI